MKRILAVVGIAVALSAGCSNPGPTQTAPSVQLSTQPSASPLPPRFSEAGTMYLEKLRTEQPLIFTGCPGQGQEESPRDVMPNLWVVGLVEFLPFSSDYPLGVKLNEYYGTKITTQTHTEPGWGTNVTVQWSNTGGPQFYSFIRHSNLIDFWQQSMQHERGGHNENNYNLINQNTAIGERWFIMAYDPKDPCAGRSGTLYNQINWTRLFETKELDLQPRQ